MTFADPERLDLISARLWRFGAASLDEGRHELRVDGTVRPLEAKPLALLVELLLRAGEVATKAELLRAVWSVNVADGSVPTAISKLRAALDDDDRTIIASVPRVGYRIGVPVAISAAPPLARIGAALRAGEPVPGRPEWRLERPLGGSDKVWLATGLSPHERLVVRIAETAHALDRLKAEWSAAEALSQLGSQPNLVHACDHDFAGRPFSLMTPYRGPSLATLRSDERLEAARIATVATVARALEAAHSIGVIHGGVSPRTILVPDGDCEGVGCLAGFGRPGRCLPNVHMAPELAAGSPPTIAADLYALGVVLYQAAIGDYRRPLANGWEADVVDPVLAGDIAAATAGDPSRRVASAALLAERLEHLERRREERRRAVVESETARVLALRAERARVRRPWAVGAVIALVLGLFGTAALNVRAVRERDMARRQVRITEAVDAFLTDDLLGRGNPLRSGKVDETLMEAVRNAEPAIGLRLRTEPLVAASLYRAMAFAFDGRSALDPARDAYARAIAAYQAAEGPLSDDATVLRLRWASMEAVSTGEEARSRARALLAETAAAIARPGPRQAEMLVWATVTRASLALVDGDPAGALRLIRDASARAEALPATFDAGTRLVFREREAVADIRGRDLTSAGRLIGRLRIEVRALDGPTSPETLLVEIDRLRLLAAAGDFAAAASLGAGLCPDVAGTFGPASHETTVCMLEQASAEIQLGQYAAGVRDEDDVYRVIVAAQGPHAYMAMVALINGGTAACRNGDLTGGVARLRTALSSMRGLFGSTSPAGEIVALQTGVCLAQDKQFSAADALFDSVDPAIADRASDHADTAATIDLARADEALSGGDVATARSWLRTPEKVFRMPGADRFLAGWTSRLVEESVVKNSLKSAGK